jgi:DNA replication and repair protein RecF
MVWVNELSLINFRNYQELTLELSAGLTLLTGLNGQGKTNLLEALYLLSHLRSPRTHHDAELIYQPPPTNSVSPPAQAGIRATVLRQGTHTTTTQLALRWRKQPFNKWVTQASLMGQPVKSRSQLLGHFPTVAFTTADLAMLKGSPTARRQWLDAATAQWQPQHLPHLVQANRLLKQKRSLLLRELNPNQDVLYVLNQQLAQAVAHVSHGRVAYLAAVASGVQPALATLGGAVEAELEWHFKQNSADPALPTALPELAQWPVAQWEQALTQRLALLVDRECAQQQSLLGHHRQDWAITYTATGLASHKFGSQGQQRSLVLALKLAERHLLTERWGEPPVLLMDDVMAELDPDRQYHLLQAVGNQGQVVLTTTHLEARLASHLADVFGTETAGQRLRVDAGSVRVMHSP